MPRRRWRTPVSGRAVSVRCTPCAGWAVTVVEPVTISFVVAMDEDNAIGRDNALPWHLPADLKHFKSVTMGKPIIMGRRTFESIGRPLPGRHNIVITRNRTFVAAGCTVVHSFDEAQQAAGGGELMVIGGAELFRELLPRAHRIHLTLIHHRFGADTHFPALDPAQWRETSRTDCGVDAQNPYAYSFLLLERVRSQR